MTQHEFEILIQASSILDKEEQATRGQDSIYSKYVAQCDDDLSSLITHMADNAGSLINQEFCTQNNRRF